MKANQYPAVVAMTLTAVLTIFLSVAVPGFVPVATAMEHTAFVSRAYTTSSSGTSSQSSWSITAQLPAHLGHIYGFSCPSSLECFAAGRRDTSIGGAILATTNSGASWSEESLPQGTGQLSGISCPSTSVCFASGAQTSGTGLILATTNSGASWSAVQLASLSADALVSIACPTIYNCVAGGMAGSGGDAAIIYTSDAGSKWSSASIPSGMSFIGSLSCVGVSCYAVGVQFPGAATPPSSVVLASSDSGVDWKSQSMPSSAPPMILQGIDCSSTTYCVSVGYSIGSLSLVPVVIVTTDGGQIWSEGSVSSSVPINAVGCASSSECFIGGCGIIMESADGGSSWHINYFISSGSLSAISCSDASDCVIAGYKVVLSSTDSGVQWEAPSLPAGVGSLPSVSCVSSSCVVAGTQLAGTPMSLYSSDGGLAWSQDLLSATAGTLSAVSCGSASQCVAVGSNTIVATSDGGASWKQQTAPSGVQSLDSISCPSVSECVAVGSSSATGAEGVFVSTTDSASVWSVGAISYGAPVSVSCVNISYCMAIAPSAGGMHWDVLQMSGVPGSISSPGTPLASAEPSAASLSWSPPATTGGLPVTHYVITPYQDGIELPQVTTPGSASTFTVSGLQDGTADTFTVAAETSVGEGPPSLASNAVTPYAPSPAVYHPLTPYRICDTRLGNPSSLSGLDAQCNGKTLAPGAILGIQVGGTTPAGGSTAGVPLTLTVTSVALTVTVVNPTATGYLTLFPANESVPLASTVNFARGVTVAHFTVLAVSPGGQVAIFNSAGDTNVVVDVEGYYSSASGSSGSGGSYFVPLKPSRICDTRPGNPSKLSGIALSQCQGRTLVGGTALSIQVTGIGGVPLTADAVVMNVTATDPTATGYVAVWPGGKPFYISSSLNFVKGAVVTDQAVVAPDASGHISFYNSSGSVNLVVDVEGYFVSTSSESTVFTAMTPSRVCDTRATAVSFITDQCTGHMLVAGAASQVLTVQVAGVSGVPPLTATATTVPQAVLINVAVTQETESGYLTIYPSGGAAPIVSELNFFPGEVTSNLVAVELGNNGSISISLSAGSAQVVADVVGWYSP